MKETIPHKEFEVFGASKQLWAIVLFMKYTHRDPRWNAARAVIREELTEEELETMTACWKTAKEHKAI